MKKEPILLLMIAVVFVGCQGAVNPPPSNPATSNPAVGAVTITPTGIGGGANPWVNATFTCATPGVQYYYTTDGTVPSPGAAATQLAFLGSLAVDVGKTVKVTATKAGYSDSAIASYTAQVSQVSGTMSLAVNPFPGQSWFPTVQARRDTDYFSDSGLVSTQVLNMVTGNQTYPLNLTYSVPALPGTTGLYVVGTAQLSYLFTLADGDSLGWLGGSGTTAPTSSTLAAGATGANFSLSALTYPYVITAVAKLAVTPDPNNQSLALRLYSGPTSADTQLFQQIKSGVTLAADNSVSFKLLKSRSYYCKVSATFQSAGTSVVYSGWYGGATPQAFDPAVTTNLGNVTLSKE